jgi:tRNA A37 threonylcarbamoyladenosine dehydratase
MDNFWLQKAHQYIKEHRAFSNVGDICLAADGLSAVICADISVGLPSRFVDAGVTETGIRSIEPVKFKFEKEFPLKAPKIILRDDFPRSFPHINPSKKEVLPCIYEGDLSEFLQQSEWMNGILNQLMDWMEKAASGSLLNYSQGWEPMRNDYPAGFIIYDIYELLQFLKDASVGNRAINYQRHKGMVIAGLPYGSNKENNSTILVCQHPQKRIQTNYIPNCIQILSDLYVYASSIGITNLKDIVEKCDSEHLDEKNLFVTLAIHRPCKIINSDENMEFLNFFINKSKPRKGKKRVLPNCKVGMLTHINKTSQKLLKKMSGSKQSINDSSAIALLGCGSLGSKIGLHLARNGNGPFLCIDHDIFLPHNNARHGLSLALHANKAEQLALAISSISSKSPLTSANPAKESDFSKSRIILDTTASLSVRSFLMMHSSLPQIISSGIYGGGRLGVTLIEATDKKATLNDLLAALYFHSLERKWLREIIFSEQKENVSIGQGCGSHTVIMSDATLSLFSSSISLIIQKVLETSYQQYGAIILTRIQNEIDVLTEAIEVIGGKNVPSIIRKDWSVRVFDHVFEKMKKQALAAGNIETGGCLIGSVFLVPKSIVITDILPPPQDSMATPTMFVLGKEGLEKKIKSLERKTNGKITYLGTWHSHPHGGEASATDKNTATRLVFLRNYEPTVCLIWTPEGVINV